MEAKKTKVYYSDESESDDEISYQEYKERQESYEKNLATPFSEQNLTLIVENTKLYVNKEQLMAASPVFERMLTSGFKEATEKEIDLPGKNLRHFIRFLRFILPGFNDSLNESIVHALLPLAREYQTDQLMKTMDSFLASMTKQNGYNYSSYAVIKNVVEAEEYSLSEYLDESIKVASRKKYTNLILNPEFQRISKETQLKICLCRWNEIDDVFTKCKEKYIYETSGETFGTSHTCMKLDQKCFGEIVKSFMKD